MRSRGVTAVTQDESIPMRRIGSSNVMGSNEGRVFEENASEGRARAEAAGDATNRDADESMFGPRVRLATRLDREEAFETIVARGPAMQALLDRVCRAAQSDSPLVLEGEPGCGKRALAKLAHELSARSDMPFVRVDCAAHDEAFVEGELFGVRRGGEARALRDREGLVQTAHRGTLLLENPAELPAVVQPKLQEFLATGEFRPVGDRWGTRCADVRVIVSSTMPLAEHASAGRMRRALYDRLAVLVLAVPSLRQRVEDIEPLVDHFAETLRDSRTLGSFSIDPDARAWLRGYPWPGNVRELQNAVEYAFTMGSCERLRCEDLPEAIRRHAQPEAAHGPASNPLASPPAQGDEGTGADRERIERVLVHCEGDIDHAARMLGITRRALRYEIARFGLGTQPGPAAVKPRVPGERLQAVLQRRSTGP